MSDEVENQATDFWCEIAFHANKFISSNSEKHLDYMIGHRTKHIVVISYIFTLLALLLIVPLDSFSIGNWEQWTVFAIMWFIGGICISKLPLHFAKEKYNRFVSRNFNYWFNEQTEAALDDEVASKEIVEHMNAANNGIQYAGKETRWSASRRIYYKIKILDQLELVELVLQTVAWTIGFIFCIRFGISL